MQRKLRESRNKEWNSWKKYQAVRLITADKAQAYCDQGYKAIPARWVSLDKNGKLCATSHEVQEKLKSRLVIDERRLGRRIIPSWLPNRVNIGTSPVGEQCCMSWTTAEEQRHQYSIPARSTAQSHRHFEGTSRRNSMRRLWNHGSRNWILHVAEMAIYGTRDAPRGFWLSLKDEVVKQPEAHEGTGELALYSVTTNGQLHGYIATHVDDVLGSSDPRSWSACRRGLPLGLWMKAVWGTVDGALGTRRPTLRSAGQTDLHERWTTTETIRQGNTRRTITDERSWEVWDGFADFAVRSSVTRLRHCRDSSVARGDGSDQGEQVSQCSSEDQWERDQVLQESLQLVRLRDPVHYGRFTCSRATYWRRWMWDTEIPIWGRKNALLGRQTANRGSTGQSASTGMVEHYVEASVPKHVASRDMVFDQGSESAQHLRAAMYGSIEPKPPGRDESWMIQASDYKEIDWLTDCISLVGYMSSTTMSSVSDKRLAIDFTTLRQEIWRPCGVLVGDPASQPGMPLNAKDKMYWVSTRDMVCDALTKRMRWDDVRRLCTDGIIFLSEDARRAFPTSVDEHV